MASQQQSNSDTLGSRDAMDKMWESNFEKLINSNRKWRKICERLVARGALEEFSYRQCCNIVSQTVQVCYQVHHLLTNLLT